MKTFYHVTKKENLKNIMKNGLLPKIGELSRDLGEKIPRVYLFPTLEDMETALSSWLGLWYEDNYGENIELCSLIITLEDDFPIESGEVEYEIYSYNVIPAQYISYLKDE